ncbi:SusC/RagA family TonB-linked outer membrane protein [Niastella vici]|uniref:SusC/RagA family TonB-linked outer membrane protein n=1 Tax=Niastella vici TaxID=1703345 RepID=A0A1V9FUI2_9BACT|nr:TonB-dependent receptor [Niastella vici]OQP61980.1 SusC/RagA family TonB-linked outer membrane protein [Niastella vici]
MKKQFYSLGRRCLLSLFALLTSVLVFSQTRPVSGKVTDSKDGTPLPGVSVTVKGQSTGVSTDINGSFSISVTKGATLVFTHTGYDGYQQVVGNEETLNVQLQLSKGSMSEVVVIGYGTVRKKDLTGSVGSVKSAQLQERPAASVNEALSGRIAGVQVSTNSGRPGGATRIRVRGFSSINSSNNPLYVVDGVYIPIGNQTLNSNSIDYINPNDIASVEVLKDASGTAIYGARGANGVVLITTKRGTNGPARVNYDGSFSVPTIGPKRVHMLNAQQYIDLENLAFDNIKVYDPAGWAAGNYSTAVDPRVKRKSLPNLFDANGNPLYNTDWLKESVQNKLTQNHQIGVTGGKDNNLYGLFLGYRDENGLLLNSYLKRYSARFVQDLKPNEWLRIGGSLAYNNQEENLVDQGTGGLNSVRMITESFPFLPVKFADGTWGDNYLYPGAEGGSNPVHIMTDRKYIVNVQNMLGHAYVNVLLGNGFDIKSQVGVSFVQRQENQFSGRTLDQISRDQNGTASIFDNREIYWSSETFLNYNKTFHGDHVVNGLIGLSWQGTNYNSVNASSQNFSSDVFQWYNLGQGSTQNASASSKSGFAFNSYFGRVNYAYKGKYLLTVTGRVDGSSKFGDNNKFAFFPSAGVAWKASDEDFLKNNNIISNLKIRASYGLTGNSEIAPYRSDAQLGSYTAIFSNARFSGIGTGRLGNLDLKWERTTQSDAGIELGLLGNRIMVEADVYYRKTTDMLLDAPLPRSTGYPSVFKNVGSLENKGFEFTINTLNINQKDFTWSTTFNISLNKNKVLSLATPAPIYSGNPNFLSNTGIIRVGDPVGSFWGLKRLGVWTEAERAEAAKFTSYRGGKPILPGDLKYLDVNGDYAINDADRMIIGHGTPKGWGSFVNSFRYKNLDLTIEIAYMYGNDILNQTHHSGEDRTGIANSFSSVLDYYQPSKNNNNTMIAAIRDTRAGYVTNVDTRWVEDGSFIRGKNLLLAYNFPAGTANFLKLSRLRVYASVQNFFLKTKFSGNDPEVTTYGDAFAQGQTFFDYPKPTTYMLGINVGL